MYSKKLAFSFFSVPVLALAHQGYEFQVRRSAEKVNET
jgi:cytochrome oxidase assembly protein ShyY1